MKIKAIKRKHRSSVKCFSRYSHYKTTFLLALLLSVVVMGANAQERPQYSYTAAFNPFFYTNSGNETRSASGAPGAKYWQNRADYNLKASLNTVKNEVTGSTEIIYTNNAPENLGFLWLQLDQNLFGKDSRGKAVNKTLNKAFILDNNFDGGYQIKAVKILSVNGKAYNLTPQYRISDTRMQVQLPTALNAKGGVVKLRIDYSFLVPPKGVARMGVLETKQGKIFALAQWYPRLCVFDDLNGWNTEPYLGNGEFYLEYGDFTAEITVPSDQYVFASGELLNESQVYTAEQVKKWNAARQSDKTIFIRDSGEASKAAQPAASTKTWKFKISQARDFAWASSNAFIIDAARINLPSGKKSLAISAYPVESDGIDKWSRSTEFTKAAIELHSRRWYEYTYPAASSIACEVGGMEYPGIVFCYWKANADGVWNLNNHEFGHNWFPMIVGSNERLHPWMDEGFNSFIQDINSKEFNNGEFNRIKKFSWDWTFERSGQMEALMNAADNINNLGHLAYYKPSLGLKLLREQILGEDVFDFAFREYIKRWAFKHPAPDDFFRTMENVSGEDLKFFWRGWFMNKWEIDQGVKKAFFVNDDVSKPLIIRFENKGQLPMPLNFDIIYDDSTRKEIKTPVDIWKKSATYEYQIADGSKVLAVEIDGKKQIPDADRSNNIYSLPDKSKLKPVDLSQYTGNFYCEKYKMHMTGKIRDGNLVFVSDQFPDYIIKYEGNNTFLADDGSTLIYSEGRNEIRIIIPGESEDIVYKREK